MSDPDVKELPTTKESTPVSTVINKEVMKFSAENTDGQHDGEIHTLNRLQGDLSDLPFVEGPLDSHFTNIASILKHRVSELKEDPDRALAYIQDLAKYRVDRGVNLTPGSGTLTTRKDLYRIPFSSKLDVPENTQRLTDSTDANLNVVNGYELGVSTDGQFAYLPKETYKMVVNAYRRQASGE